ncbi:NAD(P)-dependent oxidoreductase [Philodulcilactobacillus myokoensis]|uniref:NAD(P)-dependent oxidoreductase n=1 Tax=Philodulcilactobacillus myokoensis TaxID=2929573 RepID=A0A9W6AZL2_9LACO|nr:NAD(P)H-binding protein [Philodulcilactobacillus myokoensis]GLB46038.1 NAD(P)-dependent oxidoreductase [Philodulcilactobacillus myokoensis]
MENFLIIGATGSIGKTVTKQFKSNSDVHLTLMARNTDSIPASKQVTKVNADILDPSSSKYFQNQDAVFAALSGNLPDMAQSIMNAMHQNDVQRLVFISSMGIYNEIPASVGATGNLKYNPFLKGYRKTADLIEQSDLNYTIVRPGWFDNGSDDYEITQKNEPFGGHDVSRTAIADLVQKLLMNPKFQSRKSIGINRPQS